MLRQTVAFVLASFLAGCGQSHEAVARDAGQPDAGGRDAATEDAGWTPIPEPGPACEPSIEAAFEALTVDGEPFDVFAVDATYCDGFGGDSLEVIVQARSDSGRSADLWIAVSLQSYVEDRSPEPDAQLTVRGEGETWSAYEGHAEVEHADSWDPFEGGAAFVVAFDAPDGGEETRVRGTVALRYCGLSVCLL